MDELLKELAEYYKNRSFEVSPGQKITGTNAQLVWQFLRFSSSYRDMYDITMSAMKNTPYENERYLANAREAFSISEIIHYDKIKLPPDTFFKADIASVLSAKTIKDLPFDKVEDYLQSTVLLSVNPFVDPKTALKKIESLLENQRKVIATFLDDELNLGSFKGMCDKENPNRLRGSSGTKNLVETILCYFYYKEINLPPKKVKEKYKEIYEREYEMQNTQISRNASQFQKISEMTPWCFFYSPN